MRVVGAWCLLVMLGLAGCSSSGGDSSGEADHTDGDGNGSGDSFSDPSPNESGQDDSSMPDEPRTARWHLTGSGLSDTEPPAGFIPTDCGWGAFTPVCDMGDNEYFTDPFPQGIYVPPQSIPLQLWLESDAVAVGNPVFDVAVWFGSSRGSLGFGFVSSTILTPGAPTEIGLTLDLSGGPGLVLPAGESLMVRIAVALEPEGAGLHKILIGGATPSGIDLTLQNLTEAPAIPSTVQESFTGTLQGGAFAQCDAGPERHGFTVADDATFLNVRLVGSSATSTQADIDLDLFDGGTRIVHAGSPYPEEEILLMGEALAPYVGKTLEIGTTICLGPQVEYTAIVDQG